MKDMINNLYPRLTNESNNIDRLKLIKFWNRENFIDPKSKSF